VRKCKLCEKKKISDSGNMINYLPPVDEFKVSQISLNGNNKNNNNNKCCIKAGQSPLIFLVEKGKGTVKVVDDNTELEIGGKNYAFYVIPNISIEFICDSSKSDNELVVWVSQLNI